MPVQDLLIFETTDNISKIGIINWRFNRENLCFEFQFNNARTITCPPIITENGKLKSIKEIFQDIKDTLVNALNLDTVNKESVDQIYTATEELENQIEENFGAVSKATGNGKERESAATILVDLAKKNITKLFKDQYGYAFAIIHNEDHDELLKLSTKNEKCLLYLSRLFYQNEGKTANAEAISNATHTLQAEAVFTGNEIPLDVRVAWSNPEREEIYYDMTDPQWRRIIITKQGWRISNDINPILFIRFNQSSQIEPDRNYPPNIFDQFLDLMHIEGVNNRLLAKAWIVSLFIPDIPHVINLVFGTQGGAKSTFYRYIKRLVDPDKIELLSVPTQMPQFAQQMYHNYLVIYDNAKHLPKWFSDEICKACTGVGISKRTLFSDDDDTIYQYKRCIVINGINNIVVEPDALDRSIQMEHQRLKDDSVKEDSDVKAQFEELRPKLLAYILDILVKALQIKPDIQKIQSKGTMRMADFVYWSEAIARAMGEEPLTLANAYWENVGKQSASVIENHELAQAVILFVDTRCNPPTDALLWAGRTLDLSKELNSIAIQHKLYDDSTKKYWPKRVEDFTRKLRPVIPNLKSTSGISITIFRSTEGETKGQSFIEIYNERHAFPPVLRSASPASPASPSTKNEEKDKKKEHEMTSNYKSEADIVNINQSEAEIQSEINQPHSASPTAVKPPKFMLKILPVRPVRPVRLIFKSVEKCHRFLEMKILYSAPVQIKELQGRWVCFDTEWSMTPNNDGRKQLLSIAIVDHEGNKAVKDITDFRDITPNPPDVPGNPAEKQLLEWFITDVYYKYDCIIGYATTEAKNPKTGVGINSDLVVLSEALAAYKLVPIIDFQYEHGEYRPYILGKNNIDQYRIYIQEIVNGIFGGVYNGNGLGDVVEGILSKEKFDRLEGDEIDDMTPSQRIMYVMQDAELTYELLAYDNFKTLTIMSAIANIVKLPLVDVCHSTISNWWTSRVKTEGFDDELKPFAIPKKDYPGARVLEPVVGLYRNLVYLFDVSSLYPTMMRIHNISPETVNCSCCENNPEARVPEEVMDIINRWLVSPLNKMKYSDETRRPFTYWICLKRKGIVPQLIEELIKLKRQYKEEGNEAMEYAVKILINGFYGLFGDEHFRYSNYIVSELTTSFGKITLGRMEALAIEHSLKVIYGDTDSLFLTDARDDEHINHFKQSWA